MVIRQLDFDHFANATKLIRQSFSTVAEEFGLTPDNCPSHPAFLTAEQLHAQVENGLRLYGLYTGAELAGVVGIRSAGPGEVSIEKLAVLPVYRHRQYGTRLMTFACEQIQRDGGDKACIGIIDENTVLKQWYQRQGFIVTETKRFPHLPFTVCLMEKIVNQQLLAPLVGLSLDLIECSNRCWHCEATYEPRRKHLSLEAMHQWMEEIRQDADHLGVSVAFNYNNSELLDYPHWRELLAELGRDKLGPAFATNGRQIARHPELIEELKLWGVQWVQLTLGGGSAETHDAFACKRGAFDGLITTARIVHAAGLHVYWNYIAYHPLTEIACMSAVAQSISSPYANGRYRHKGGIDQGISLVKPQGEGMHIEHLRPTRENLHELPAWATTERFSTWYGVGCSAEDDLVQAISQSERPIGCLELGHLGGSSLENLVVCRNGDVYPYCHERISHYLLGNLNTNGLAFIIDRFLNNPPPGLAIRRRGLPELAAQHGDRACDKLHNGCSLCRTLVQRALYSEQA